MRISKTIKATLAALAIVGSSLTGSAEISREHRAMWMSTWLGSWPSSALNESNATTQKNILNTRLNKLRDQNINILYYHVRSACDAMYESAYEPWAASASGTRGVAPAFDPFGYLVEQAHIRGIEVYAWVNPYRYNTSHNLFGDGELNYENSHPEWLLYGSSEIRINPGIEAVQQRVVDVCKDIITKYDVDGVVFDDYFYASGTSTGSDGDGNQYAAYKSAGGTLSQADWRRDNVNQMVRRVGEMIKETKPWVRFGMAPAGVASPPNVTTEYGLPAAPGSDWQYGSIFSDPLNWLKNQYIDYMSPQIYWSTTANYKSLSEWWRNAAEMYGRHMYVSTDINNIASNFGYGGIEEFIQQTLWVRDLTKENEAGMVFFDLRNWVNYYEKYNGTSNQSFGDIMKDAVYQYKALVPLRPWNNKRNPVMTSNVASDGTTLTWDAVEGMRYTVYAVPEGVSDAEFYCQREYLETVTYTNSYSIPREKQEGYRWAVAVYDRYGNEYSPLFAGASKTTLTPATLVAPINGEAPLALFKFRWTGEGSHFTVEVAEDAAFTNVVGAIESYTTEASSASLKGLNDGQTYYWRVTSAAPNALGVVSNTATFKNSANFEITSPATGATGLSLTPTISWSKAEEGASYLLEISKDIDFATITYSAETTTPTHTVAQSLAYYTTYYVRVTASKDGQTVKTGTVEIKTLDPTSVPAPEFVTPSANGVTLYCDDKIEVKPWVGYNKVRIELSASSTSFASRTSFIADLTDFACTTVELGDESVKVGSPKAALVDGTTYYVRAYGQYACSSSTSKKTDYTEVMSFVYSSQSGVEGIDADAEGKVYITNNNELVLGNEDAEVAIYAITGQLVNVVTATGNYSLDWLAAGTYVVKVKNNAGVTTVKFVK